MSTLRRTFLSHWHFRTLRTKLLLPILGLMLLALLGSVLVFVISTLWTQEQLLQQETATEAHEVARALDARMEHIHTATSLLAEDPETLTVINQSGEDPLMILNSRAIVVRDRFNLDLVQIYNRQGRPRVNIMLSSLYRGTTLLDKMDEVPSTTMLAVDDRLLLLQAQRMPDGAGMVLTGIDLASELKRIITNLRLGSDLGLYWRKAGVATQENFDFEVEQGHQGTIYTQRLPLILGEQDVTLILIRPIQDIQRVAHTGLVVMVVSTLLTTLLLVAFSVLTTRALARPIQRLSETVKTVAEGDLTAEVTLPTFGGLFSIGEGDEIGELARDFNGMVYELRDLYANLESKVNARTEELTLATEMARAVSSSLELDVVLRQSVRLIYRRLGFDHILAFTIRSGSNLAVLREAVGQAGERLKAQEFRFPLVKRSMIGAAVSTRCSQIAQDLSTSTLHLHVSPLPDTGSAVALPIIGGDRVLGILYIHTYQRHAFSPELIDLLETLADQIAVGFHNAQLYAQQRETAERLAEIDRLKTEFLANMSHELRTPLNSIIGFSKLLLKEMEGPLNETQAQELEIIYESGKHLLSLINDILDVSKINAGKMRLNLEALALKEMAEEALEVTEGLIKDKSINLRLDIAPDLPPVQADRRRVRQIFLNLLSNAAKFTREGTITLRLQEIEFFNAQTEELEPYVEVSVIDTGVGIPEDRQVDIFEEFTQVDSSSSRQANGTGLGLPLTKKLVELHGGKIWVESREGEGSTFTFVLPLTPEYPKMADRASRRSKQGVKHAT